MPSIQQLSAEGEVNVAEYLPRRRRGKYLAIFTDGLRLIIVLVKFSEKNMKSLKKIELNMKTNKSGLALQSRPNCSIITARPR